MLGLLAFVLLSSPLLVSLGGAVVPGAGSYSVMSSSMEPTIGAGSLIYVYDTDDYQEGDVITFTHGGQVVTHRITEVTATGVETKGDANDSPDSWTVSRDEIRGEVVFVLPLYGRFVSALSTHRELAFLWAGVAILAIYADDLLAGKREN